MKPSVRPLRSSMAAVSATFTSENVVSSARRIANAYDLAGDEYLAYADGDAENNLSFTGKYAYADRSVWSHLEKKLIALRQSGADSVRILDVGCGPGTWTRRLVMRARELGFSNIVARGFDLSSIQIQQARARSLAIAAEAGVSLEFDVADLTSVFREEDASVDLTLCLYSVLSHIPAEKLPGVVDELARVTRGHLIVTVRAVGSMPSGIVADIEDVRQFHLDHRSNCYQIELDSGRKEQFYLHLFSSSEISNCFSRGFETEVMQGLDFFHHRFSSDLRWNPQHLALPTSLAHKLSELEASFAVNPDYIDHANHIFFIGGKVQGNLLAEEKRESPLPAGTHALR